MRICTHEECQRPAIARGMCSTHYQRLRTVDGLERERETDCRHCGVRFAVGNFGRLPFYCSERCKDNASYKRKAEAKGRRAESCENCGASLADKKPHARFCSAKCGQDWHNRSRSAQARELRASEPRPCRNCGGVIPLERHGRARFCNDVCKMSARRHEAYNLTRQELELLLVQHDVCAICRSSDWGQKGPQVDHDHVTGRVRGILCTSCNQGLGRFRDQPDLLEAAAVYLRH